MGRMIAVLASVMFLAGPGWGADSPPRHKTVTAGPLTLNPRDVIAVYRPVDGQSVAVVVGRPGQGTQTIFVRDYREAAAVFNDLWNNAEITKDPGDDDARPLTRMMVKEKPGEADEKVKKRSGTLIVNADRVLAVAWDSAQRMARVYFDRPAIGANAEAARERETETLDVANNRDEADVVIAAYKACVVGR